ncbi:MAG: hypothetical protein KGN84_01020 [Acidobacteriota bacterium]|nr:hypothetical protein [Acidobacteriota bacterium]
MGNVQFHSESSARRFGGTPEDYVAIHKFLDQSKLYIADWRHRALLHNTFGVALAEQFFGDLYKRPSDGESVATRTVAEVHILEDMQAILTPAEFLREMPIRRWMNGLTLEQRRAAQSLRIPERNLGAGVVPSAFESGGKP